MSACSILVIGILHNKYKDGLWSRPMVLETVEFNSMVTQQFYIKTCDEMYTLYKVQAEWYLLFLPVGIIVYN